MLAMSLASRGDEGIDGTIKEDKLGLDMLYIQAKRWEGTVGRPEVQKFAGSMEGARASKGVFITTSSFSKDAEEFVEKIARKIVLIDGDALAQLMIDHDVGVATARTYTVKKMDSDYFTEGTCDYHHVNQRQKVYHDRHRRTRQCFPSYCRPLRSR